MLCEVAMIKPRTVHRENLYLNIHHRGLSCFQEIRSILCVHHVVSFSLCMFLLIFFIDRNAKEWLL